MKKQNQAKKKKLKDFTTSQIKDPKKIKGGSGGESNNTNTNSQSIGSEDILDW